MHLTINDDGNLRIDLEPDDEQLIVNIGGADVWLTGGAVGTSGLTTASAGPVDPPNGTDGSAVIPARHPLCGREHPSRGES